MTTTRKTLPAELRPSVARIVKTFRSATDAQLAEGIAWYADAHSLALALDPANPARAAGVIAALSPKQKWPRNVTLAARAYADGEASGTMGDQTRKATRILRGEAPSDVLRGSKVRAFHAVILDPTDPDAVVIDRHAFNVAIGHVSDEAVRSTTLRKPWAYEAFADAYRRAGRQLGVSPSQVQAVTWVVWRQTSAHNHAFNAKSATA